MSDIMEQLWKEAVQEGIREANRETALRMLVNGKLSLEEIAEFSGLSLEEVKKLQKDTNA